MKNALANFGQLNANKKIVILGDMLELGEFSDEEHLDITQQAIDLSFDQVILVGREFAKVKMNGVHYFENVNDLKVWFSNRDFRETYFLIKGSRGIKLELLLS